MNTLPNEVLCTVFDFLSPKDLLGQVPLLSRQWARSAKYILSRDGSHLFEASVSVMSTPTPTKSSGVSVTEVRLSRRSLSCGHRVLGRLFISIPSNFLDSRDTEAIVKILGQEFFERDILIEFRVDTVTFMHNRPSQSALNVIKVLQPARVRASDDFFVTWLRDGLPPVASVFNLTLEMRDPKSRPYALNAALAAFPDVIHVHAAGRDADPATLIAYVEPDRACLVKGFLAHPEPRHNSLWHHFRTFRGLRSVVDVGFVDLMNDPWWWEESWQGMRGPQPKPEGGQLPQVTTLRVRLTPPESSRRRIPQWWSWERRERNAVSAGVRKRKREDHEPAELKIPLFGEQVARLFPALEIIRFTITHPELVAWINVDELEGWVELIRSSSACTFVFEPTDTVDSTMWNSEFSPLRRRVAELRKEVVLTKDSTLL
ncbi:hypothetical protein HDU93_005210 [Gonapodya sp. JEL0774]|nr:hypothetical protein HDU93_005210 [Gonapodya sp. JEL0774]